MSRISAPMLAVSGTTFTPATLRLACRRVEHVVVMVAVLRAGHVGGSGLHAERQGAIDADEIHLAVVAQAADVLPPARSVETVGVLVPVEELDHHAVATGAV